MIEQITKLMSGINMPTVLLLIIILFRKNLQLLFSAIGEKIKTANTVKIGKDGIELTEKIKDLENKINESKANVTFLTDNVLDNTIAKPKKNNDTIKSSEESIEGQVELTLEKDVLDIDDPNKGKYGGQKESNGRKASATIKKINNSAYYNVAILIESTNISKPLTGIVHLKLHPTYIPIDRTVNVVQGIAELNIISYGTFTVGIIADDGKTMLELDLAHEEGADDNFRAN
jgi:hypothetical protein